MDTLRLKGRWVRWVCNPTDIWEPLAVHENVPPDLFNNLYDAVVDYLALPTQASTLEEIKNDTVKAYDAFIALRGSDFIEEKAVLVFLEKAYEIIADYDITGYAELFKLLLQEFIRKYNLRYRLDDPFKIRFLLPGSFANLYTELQRLNTTDAYLSGLFHEFEYTFDVYVRTQNLADLKTCIGKASNYAEGLASCTLGNPKKNNTLGALAGKLSCWPHNRLKDSLIDLYNFCSDYPGIRHGGTPSHKRRELTAIDSTLVCLLLLCFSGYLSPNVDELSVLGV